MVIAETFRELLHARLLVKLELRDILDQAEIDLALAHLVNRRLNRLCRARRAKRLLAREHDFGNLETIEAVIASSPSASISMPTIDEPSALSTRFCTFSALSAIAYSRFSGSTAMGGAATASTAATSSASSSASPKSDI